MQIRSQKAVSIPQHPSSKFKIRSFGSPWFNEVKAPAWACFGALLTLPLEDRELVFDMTWVKNSACHWATYLQDIALARPSAGGHCGLRLQNELAVLLVFLLFLLWLLLFPPKHVLSSSVCKAGDTDPYKPPCTFLNCSMVEIKGQSVALPSWVKRGCELPTGRMNLAHACEKS